MAIKIPEAIKDKMDSAQSDEKILAKAIAAGLAAWTAKKLVDALFARAQTSEVEDETEDDHEDDQEQV